MMSSNCDYGLKWLVEGGKWLKNEKPSLSRGLFRGIDEA